MFTRYVYAAPGINGLLHHGLHGLKVGDRCAIGHGLATRRANLGHHGLGCGERATGTIARTAQIVHHHFGAACGQGQRMLATQAAACARYDGHAAFEIQMP